MILQFLSTSLITGIMFIIYFLFFGKIKLSKDLTRDGTKSPKQKMKKRLNVGKMPPVYPNGWYNLLESFALKEGQVKHVAALGQNFAIFRTKSGKACVLDAYCPHLGANLAEGGIVKDDDLECPFHAWRFCGNTGKCTDIPYAKNVPPTFKTKAWDSVEVNGFILVWYHAEFTPPHWWPRQVKHIANGSWKLQGHVELYVEGHIQDLAENTADLAHFNVLHDFNLPAKFFSKKIFHHCWTSLKWSAYSENDPAVAARFDELHEISDVVDYRPDEKHKAVTVVDQRIKLFNVTIIAGRWPLLLIYAGPGYLEMFVKTCIGCAALIHSVTPIKPRVQRVSLLMYTPTILAPLSKISIFVDYYTISSDARVWKFKKYLENPMLVKEDQSVKSFRKWFSQFYSENSPTYESCKNDSIEW